MTFRVVLDHPPPIAVNRKDMRVLIPALILSGCGVSASVGTEVELDSTPVKESVRAVQPGPLLDLVHQTDAVIGTEADCPRIEAIVTDADTRHERWFGGCTLEDGTEVLGTIERFSGPDHAWITGTDFRLAQNGDVVFGFDGAIEVTEVDALWLVDVSASICGTEDWSCTEGLLGMDLTSTIFPASGFPDNYNITVSGAVATDRSTMTVDGAWTVDHDSCAVEPTDGSLTIRQGSLHALTLDGAIACDACGEWEVQGQPTPGLCGLNQ